jgi:ribokinase
VSKASTELCVLGDFAWDLAIRTNSGLLKGGDTFGEVVLLPGGSAANVAVWAARCGCPPTSWGRSAAIEWVRWPIENLDDEGVLHHLVESDSNLTGSAAVFVDHTGERSMVSEHGADFYLLPSEPPRDVITASAHLHLTAWSFFTDPPRSAARAAAHLAQQAGATLSFDPASFQMIGEMGVDHVLAVTQDLGIDVFLPNKEEGAVLTGVKEPEEIARELDLIYPSALVILKLDAGGALVWQGGEAHHIPPATNNLVDATGAGDSFAGAFLARYLAGQVRRRRGTVRHHDLGLGDRTPGRPASSRATTSGRARGLKHPARAPVTSAGDDGTPVQVRPKRHTGIGLIDIDSSRSVRG